MSANNMTNKELLVLAAKAANYDVVEESDGLPFTIKEDNDYFTWNPLTNDGDALRLAVKLNITVSNSEAQKHSCASVLTVPGICLNQHNGAPYAATRRAIVRAAAAIASNLNKE